MKIIENEKWDNYTSKNRNLMYTMIETFLVLLPETEIS